MDFEYEYCDEAGVQKDIKNTEDKEIVQEVVAGVLESNQLMVTLSVELKSGLLKCSLLKSRPLAHSLLFFEDFFMAGLYSQLDKEHF